MAIFQKIGKVLGALVLAFSLACAGVFFAMQPTGAVEQPEYRLQISPTRLDINLVPGKSSSDTFRVQNTGTKKYSFKVGVDPFNVSGENYAVDSSTKTAYNDVVDWITFSKSEGSVEPGQQVEIKVTVKVPKDVPAGGQYAMVYAQMTEGEDDDSTSVNVQRRAGILVYSDVAGDTRQTGQVIENKIPSILFNPPIIATSMVENTGNVHTNATYALEVYPLFSDEEVYTTVENPETLTILPETRRFNTISWDGAPHLGIFKVIQTVTIFGETSTTEQIVFLCPLWFLFIILLIIFCAIFWLFSRVRSRRQEKSASRRSEKSSAKEDTKPSAEHHEKTEKHN